MYEVVRMRIYILGSKHQSESHVLVSERLDTVQPYQIDFEGHPCLAVTRTFWLQ